MRISFVLLVLLATAASAAECNAQCKKDLSYLSEKIPPVADNPKLKALRDAMLATDIDALIANIRSQGLTLPEAADKMFKQADAYEKQLPNLESCIRNASTDGDRIIRDLKARNYKQVVSGEDALGACVSSYIAYDWGQISNREMAVQVACNAK